MCGEGMRGDVWRVCVWRGYVCVCVHVHDNVPHRSGPNIVEVVINIQIITSPKRGSPKASSPSPPRMADTTYGGRD